MTRCARHLFGREALRHMDPRAACVMAMAPESYLALVAPLPLGADDRRGRLRVARALQQGIRLGTLPRLTMRVSGREAWVVGHDGRQRATALHAGGFGSMPVLVVLQAPHAGGPGRDAAAVVAGLTHVHPQPHAAGREYPGWSDRELAWRLARLEMARLDLGTMTVEEARAALPQEGDGAAG